MDDAKSRNPYLVLYDGLSEAKTTWEVLSRLNPQHEERCNSTTPDTHIQELQDEGVYCAAMYDRIVMLVARMFDQNYGGKEVISFKTESFFVDNPRVKEEIDSIFGHRIVQKILETRKSWVAHPGRKEKEILQIDELLKSDLSALFSRLERILTEFLFVHNEGMARRLSQLEK